MAASWDFLCDEKRATPHYLLCSVAETAKGEKSSGLIARDTLRFCDIGQ